MAKDSTPASSLEIEQFKNIPNERRAKAMHAYLTQKGMDQATAGSVFTSDNVQAAWLMSTIMRAYGFYNQEGGRNGGRYPGDPLELVQDFVKQYCPEQKGAAPEGAYKVFRQKWFEKQNQPRQKPKLIPVPQPSRQARASTPAGGSRGQVRSGPDNSSSAPGQHTLFGPQKLLMEFLNLSMLIWDGVLLWMFFGALTGFWKIVCILAIGVTCYVSGQYAVSSYRQQKPLIAIVFGILLRFTIIETLLLILVVKIAG